MLENGNVKKKFSIIVAINSLLKLAVSSIQDFQSNRECSFKELFHIFFPFTLNFRKDWSKFNSPTSTSPISHFQACINIISKIKNLSINLNKYLTNFFAAIWYFLILRGIFKTHEGNYTCESARGVCKQKTEMYNYLKDSLKSQI